MRKLRATILAAGLIFGLVGQTMAAGPDGDHVSFTLSGFCSFDVVVDLTTWQQVRLVQTAPDGTTTTIVTGRATGTVTNVDTGATIPINVSDPAKITENPDGSVDFQVSGPALSFFADPTNGDFLLILNFGLERVHLGDSVSFQTIGRQVDVCAALA
jgi:hypothetical protein